MAEMSAKEAAEVLEGTDFVEERAQEAIDHAASLCRKVEAGELREVVHGNQRSAPMKELNIEEIRAVAEKATPGPWKVGDGTQSSFYNGKNAVILQSGRYVIADRAVYPDSSDFNDQVFSNMDFIANARQWVPALCDRVEELEQENESLRANAMIHERIITNGRNPIQDDKMVHLILDKNELNQETAILRRALGMACDDLNSWRNRTEYSNADRFIQQAQEEK